MPVGTTAAIIGGASLLGGIFGSSSASRAAKAQAQAAQQAARVQREMYQQTRADLSPYRDTGARSLDELASLYGLRGTGAQTDAFGRFRTDPGYEFGLNEGLRATEGSAAAGGKLMSGGTLKALQRYGQGYADQQYGNYLNRFTGLANMGQNAAAQTGTFGAQAAGQQGQYINDAGAARAGGYLGQANAISGSLNNAANAFGYLYGRGYGGSGFGK